MTSNGPPSRSMSPSESDGFPAPHYPHLDIPSAPSIISSRMTDIASEDGDAAEASAARQSQSPTSPVDSSMTAASSRGAFPMSARRKFPSHLHGKRTSGTSTIASGSGRTASMTSRSHVPSLPSNAFYNPMSSQKLQAQRGGARPQMEPSQIPQQPSSPISDDMASPGTIRQSIISNPMAQPQSPTHENDHIGLPPSRGSEMTEPDTYDRITATTSPTQGYYPAGSTSESVRPLHKKQSHGAAAIVQSASKERQNIPSPAKSSRSFRSSFLMPSRSDNGQHSRNRSTEGAEKLSSNASSPRLGAYAQGGPSHQEQQQQQQQQSTGHTVGKVFEYFEGNTRFGLGGRWQNTRQKPINVATGLLIVAPCVLFFVFEASWLWHNISPALPIIFAYLAYVCFSSFFHASVSDPGILPRNLHQFPPVTDSDDPLRLGPPSNDWTLIKSAERNTAAMEVPVKHCRTCNIWRPPRAHHCRLCDNCIEGHDHHCVWLHNCVGKRNYRYFFTFVTSATLLAAYLMATSLAQLIVYKNRQGISFGDSMRHFKGAFALVIIGFVLFSYPAALMGYHIFLMARGETTREYMNSHKFVKSERFRAFTQVNPFRNFLTILCRPRPPTYYQFKSDYHPGDQRLNMLRHGRPRTTSQGLEMQNVSSAGQGFQGPVSLRQEQV
jgi:palmitoyltransferase ZDHHC9/14/18